MKKTILILASVISLCGCVVAPYRPVVYAPEPVVAYPYAETAYIWDPVASSFFFVYGGRRHYMERGWNYRTYGAPRGHYHH